MWRLYRGLGLLAAAPAVTVAGNLEVTAKHEQVNAVPATSHKLRLVHVQVYFRHGARTPLSKSPSRIEEVIWHEDHCTRALEDAMRLRIEGPVQFKTPDLKRLPGGCNFGALTNQGRRNARDLGDILRKRYIEESKFISDEFKAEDVYVRSTDFTRTVASAQMVMEGLFGDSARHAQIHVLPRGEETFSMLWKKCPAIRAFHARAMEILAASQAMDPVMQRVAVRLGVMPHEVEVVALLDIINARTAHGKDLPLSSEESEGIHRKAVDLLRSSMSSSEENLALTVSPIFDVVEDTIRQAVKGNFRKMSLFSVHDTTLVPMLLGWDVFDQRWPGFSAAITIELLQDEANDGGYFVRVLYNNREIVLPACGSVLCPLDTFFGIMRRYQRPDWEQDCKMLPEGLGDPQAAKA